MFENEEVLYNNSINNNNYVWLQNNTQKYHCGSGF